MQGGKTKCILQSSSSTSKNSSPQLGPSSKKIIPQNNGHEHNSQNRAQQEKKIHYKNGTDKAKDEWKIQEKTWILLIMKAVESDLAKTQVKCTNSCCVKMVIRNADLKKRRIVGQEMWLCNGCLIAFNKKQYCEFCGQIYNTDESANLYGKEWAQCEDCGRWGHVECLCTKYNQPREIIIAENFKYECCVCQKKISGKRKNKYV